MHLHLHKARSIAEMLSRYELSVELPESLLSWYPFKLDTCRGKCTFASIGVANVSTRVYVLLSIFGVTEVFEEPSASKDVVVVTVLSSSSTNATGVRHFSGLLDFTIFHILSDLILKKFPTEKFKSPAIIELHVIKNGIKIIVTNT